MSPEVMSSIITSLIAAFIGLLIGRYGLMRNLSSLVDSRVQKMNTESQIALTREQTDMRTVNSLSDQLSSLTELLRTQLIQDAQRQAQYATAQTTLASKINEFLEEFRASQRTANNRVDDVLRSYGQDIKTVETGFRTIADGFVLSNSSMTRIIQQWNIGMDDIREMFSSIRDDIAVLRSDADSSNQYVGEVLEIAISMRNTIFTLTGQSDDKLIRSPFDTRPIPVPSDLLFKHHEIKKPVPEPEVKPVEPVPITEKTNINPPEEKHHETNQ